PEHLAYVDRVGASVDLEHPRISPCTLPAPRMGRQTRIVSNLAAVLQPISGVLCRARPIAGLAWLPRWRYVRVLRAGRRRRHSVAINKIVTVLGRGFAARRSATSACTPVDAVPDCGISRTQPARHPGGVEGWDCKGRRSCLLFYCGSHESTQ